MPTTIIFFTEDQKELSLPWNKRVTGNLLPKTGKRTQVGWAS
jgi:hypothetical protein